MKIRSDIHAGATFEQCDVQRDCWKKQAELMEKYAEGSGSVPSGLVFPASINSYCGGSSGSGGYPSGGGYVNGVYYPDMSGYCGKSTSGGTGGGYVNGVYYPDKSGSCY